jgi:hypothetical protein
MPFALDKLESSNRAVLPCCNHAELMFSDLVFAAITLSGSGRWLRFPVPSLIQPDACGIRVCCWCRRQVLFHVGITAVLVEGAYPNPYHCITPRSLFVTAIQA